MNRLQLQSWWRPAVVSDLVRSGGEFAWASVGALLWSCVVSVASISLLCAADVTPTAGQQPVSSPAVLQSAVQERLLDTVRKLAADEWEGRGVGTAGLDRAAEFIRDEFAAAGLDLTAVGGQPFQSFELTTGTRKLDDNRLEIHGPQGERITLELGVDAEVCSFGASREFSGELVFAGYAVDADEADYHDLKGLDLNGKVLIVMRRTPQQDRPESPFNSPHGGPRHADLRSKMMVANSAGAAAVLFVNDPHSSKKLASNRREKLVEQAVKIADQAEKFLGLDAAAGEALAAARAELAALIQERQRQLAEDKSANDDALMSVGYGGNGEGQTLPAWHLKQTKVDELLTAALQKKLADLEREIDSDGKPRTQVLTGWTAKGRSHLEREKATVKNVIGVLPGHGSLADETIVIGAHYDHVGFGGANSLAPGSNEVHNGADDNASGTSVLLELARRLGKRHGEFSRRLVFIAFTGEELGLLGSARYCKEPVFPLERTVAMLNLDMVGRLQDEKLIVYGTGTSERWEPLLNKLGPAGNFQLSFKPEGFGPSDHSSFYAKQIPVLHFFTGNHPDYHRPSDDWEKINADGMTRVANLLEGIVDAIVNDPERPGYIEVKTAVAANRGGNRPYFGTIPDFGTEEPGYSVTGAAPGSPAEAAGLKGGDRIIQLGPHKVTGLDDFDLALRKFQAGDTVDVIVVRKQQEVTLRVTLGAPK